MLLQGKKILIGVTGSIAAYKSLDLIQEFKAAGAEVQVILTHSAARMVTPLTFSALTGRPTPVEAFVDSSPNPMAHIELARWADLFVIAPCTAHTLAELALGLTGSMVSLVFMAHGKPCLIAPAMNTVMLNSPATLKNIRQLRERGHRVLPSRHGELACGEVGEGKLLTPSIIREYASIFLFRREIHPNLRDKRCLILVGHTLEAVDGVRSLQNESSGKTGLAMARALELEGARVKLIAGYLDVAEPEDLERYTAGTTESFHKRSLALQKDYDVILVAAALSDYLPKQSAEKKITDGKSLKKLELKPAPHVLRSLCADKPSRQKIVGFALENSGESNRGFNKLKGYGCDLMVINEAVSRDGASGIGHDTVRAAVLGPKDKIPKRLPLVNKYSLADSLLDRLNSLF